MARIKLILEYDGSFFHGWQKQKDQKIPTIQNLLEEKLSLLEGAPVSTVAASRTDAGVHARGQCISFDFQRSISPIKLQKALNCLLKNANNFNLPFKPKLFFQQISVIKAEIMPPNFHARYDAKSKVYYYYILNRKRPSAFLDRYSWFLSKPLNVAAMQKALEILKGEHDFSAFQNSGSEVENPVRCLFSAKCMKKGNLIIMRFQANGYLRKMVRNIVGTLVQIQKVQDPAAWMKNILISHSRQAGGEPAPAKGLFLYRVNYK